MNAVDQGERLSSASAERATFRLGLVLLTIGLAVTVWRLQAPFTFPLDDAYITLHNARVLWRGADPNYGVSALVGATSLIHLALVAAAVGLIGQPLLAGFLVGALGVGVYLQALATLAYQRELSTPIVAGVVLIGLFTAYAGYHLFNGLETGWAMAGVAWALALATRERPSRALAVLCGLLPFLRPELAAFAAALMARQAWLRWRERDVVQIAVDAGLCIAAAFPWLAWSWIETGALLPATSQAKQAFFAEGAEPLWIKLATVLAALCWGLGAALGPLVATRRTSLTWAAWTFVLIFAGAFALTFPGGLTHNHFRYTYVLLPVCLWALCGLRGTRLFLPLMLVCLAGAAISAPRALTDYRNDQETTGDGLALGAWAQANLPAGSRVLVHDAGAPAYASSLRLIDLVGLKTPASMADHQRWTAPSGGRDRGEAVHAIALRARVTHAIVLDDEARFWSPVADNLRAHGWRLEKIRPSGVRHGYDLYRLTEPRP